MLYTRTHRRYRTPGILFTTIVAALPAFLAVAAPATAAARPASHVRLAQTTQLPPPPPPFGNNNAQPADLNDDGVISPLELSTYATDFLTGMAPAQGPNPIMPLDLSNAATIFLTASGVYHFDSTMTPPYVPGPGTTARAIIGSANRLASTRSTAPREASAPLGSVVAVCPATFVPGSALTITLNVNPAKAAHAYAIEDTVPAGWSVSRVSNGGVYNASSHTVRWFFMDRTARSLQYRVIPSGSLATAVFHGDAAFDSVGGTIEGVRSLTPQPGLRGSARA